MGPCHVNSPSLSLSLSLSLGTSVRHVQRDSRSGDAASALSEFSAARHKSDRLHVAESNQLAKL